MKQVRTVLPAPVLKWAGGKRQLLPAIRKYMPKSFSRYAEPFLGGGAVLFGLRPASAMVNDVNTELINVYSIIKNHPDSLLRKLKIHAKKHSRDYFHTVRAQDRAPGYSRRSPVTRAARIIYLNRTCYNGLYRVNQAGQFNAPFGRYDNPGIVLEPLIRADSSFLNHSQVALFSEDFETFMDRIPPGTFVYLDPPYHPLSETSSFTGYSQRGFSASDQERLKLACDKLGRKECQVLLSNSSSPLIMGLYQTGYRQIKVKASRAINSVGSKRGSIHELLIANY